MKRLIVMASALILGMFILSTRPTVAQAAAASGVSAAQSEIAKAGGITNVQWRGRYGHWRGGGWGPGYRRWGWGGPGYYRRWGWGVGPYWGYRRLGPRCRWRCGPYRCWRVCW